MSPRLSTQLASPSRSPTRRETVAAAGNEAAEARPVNMGTPRPPILLVDPFRQSGSRAATPIIASRFPLRRRLFVSRFAPLVRSDIPAFRRARAGRASISRVRSSPRAESR